MTGNLPDTQELNHKRRARRMRGGGGGWDGVGQKNGGYKKIKIF